MSKLYQFGDTPVMFSEDYILSIRRIIPRIAPHNEILIYCNDSQENLTLIWDTVDKRNTFCEELMKKQNEIICNLKVKMNDTEEKLGKIEKMILEIYHAPNMPGFFDSKESFEKSGINYLGAGFN